MIPIGRVVPAVLSSLIVVGCAASPPPSAAAPGPAAAPRAASVASEPAPAPSSAPPGATPASGTCDLVCEGAHVVVPRTVAPEDSADAFTQAAVEHANEILNGMHDDLLACYTKRLTQRATAHGFLTLDIVVGPSGAVQDVETQGGALLGDAAMACIVNRIKGARFDPPHGGGTMRLEVPFTLRRMSPEPGDAI